MKWVSCERSTLHDAEHARIYQKGIESSQNVAGFRRQTDTPFVANHLASVLPLKALNFWQSHNGCRTVGAAVVLYAGQLVCKGDK